MKSSDTVQAVTQNDNVPEGTLRSRVQSILRKEILDGRFQAGEKLVERELCEMTGASRSVLREVLVHLETRGLIESQSFRGFRVVRLSARNIRDIFELRVELETFAAELFTERASDQELAALTQAFASMEECAANFDQDQMRAAKAQYYEVLFIGARNPEIQRALENVIDRVFYLRSRLMSDPARRKASIAEFRNLTSALVARDRLGARLASIAHLNGARDAILGRIAQENDLISEQGGG